MVDGLKEVVEEDQSGSCRLQRSVRVSRTVNFAERTHDLRRRKRVNSSSAQTRRGETTYVTVHIPDVLGRSDDVVGRNDYDTGTPDARVGREAVLDLRVATSREGTVQTEDLRVVKKSAVFSAGEQGSQRTLLCRPSSAKCRWNRSIGCSVSSALLSSVQRSGSLSKL